MALLNAHQRDDKERQTGDDLLLQTGEKMIQPIGLLPRFADHTFITGQQINVIFLEQVLPKELPEHLRPGNGRVVKTLDRAVAAAFPGPA